ncbi:MAG: MBL fold metallo-hydrolase [Spirulinaceae cyanobacterium SM2_1_0]|nr:MBL fold metallo-hydrolase [Spirulinaceae cyanobacterium SM2_1_0]
MQLTYLDSNTWLIVLGRARILVDPWLVGPLVFGNLPWLFKGERRSPRAIPDDIDLILLSQGIEDHAHPPTLRQLDRQLPVVASPSAAQVVTGLEFQQVTALAHGQTCLVGSLTIQALPGAPLGPLNTENGYLVREAESGESFYYEPHGFPPAALRDCEPVDVAITPIVSLSLPLAGPIINGGETAVQVAAWLRPQVLLPTAAGGDVEFAGVLTRFLQAQGSADELREALAARQLTTQVIEPTPGQPLTLPTATAGVS